MRYRLNLQIDFDVLPRNKNEEPMDFLLVEKAMAKFFYDMVHGKCIETKGSYIDNFKVRSTHLFTRD